jgi:hypothetical protein
MEIQPILIVRMPSHKTEDEVANVFLDFEESPIVDQYAVLVLKNYSDGPKEIQFECVNSNQTKEEFESLKNRLLKEMESAQKQRLNM